MTNRQVQNGVEWLAKVLDSSVYDTFMSYFDKEVAAGDVSLMDGYYEGDVEESGSAAGYELMLDGFIWSETEEGFDYWHEQLEDIMPQILHTEDGGDTPVTTMAAGPESLAAPSRSPTPFSVSPGWRHYLRGPCPPEGTSSRSLPALERGKRHCERARGSVAFLFPRPSAASHRARSADADRFHPNLRRGEPGVPLPAAPGWSCPGAPPRGHRGACSPEGLPPQGARVMRLPPWPLGPLPA